MDHDLPLANIGQLLLYISIVRKKINCLTDVSMAFKEILLTMLMFGNLSTVMMATNDIIANVIYIKINIS